jgi:hypothetical protein
MILKNYGILVQQIWYNRLVDYQGSQAVLITETLACIVFLQTNITLNYMFRVSFFPLDLGVPSFKNKFIYYVF